MKIAVLGRGVVGKSSLIYRYIEYNAPDDYEPTLEDKFERISNINGKDYKVIITDTAGEEDYQNMIDSWINGSDGFLLVFAINEKESFQILDKKRDKILKAKVNKPCSILLVGNKLDLEVSRQVSNKDAVKKANDWGIEYVETSAKLNVMCKEAFEKLIESVINSKKNDDKKCCCSLV